MSRPTTGVRRIDTLDEGGWIACLYGPTDLDEVLLAVAADRGWCDDDQPTSLPGDGWAKPAPEVRAGWWRKTPCPPNACGEHAWHIREAVEGERSAFLGVGAMAW